MALAIGPRWGRVVLLGLMGLFSVYLATLDGGDHGAFAAPLPLGAVLATAATPTVWFATSGPTRLRWWGYGTVGLCIVAAVCSVTAWWLWLTLWRPAGYPDHDPAANVRVDLWLARADYSYFVAFGAAAALVSASAIGVRRPTGAKM